MNKFAILAVATSTTMTFCACSGVTASGPIAFLGNQSFSKFKGRQYYENGALKSTLEIEGYGSTNPNPELTQALRDLGRDAIIAKSLIEVTEATTTNPNRIPNDPENIPLNPNKIPKDVNSIPLNPNVIPK